MDFNIDEINLLTKILTSHLKRDEKNFFRIKEKFGPKSDAKKLKAKMQLIETMIEKLNDYNKPKTVLQ